MAYPQIDDILEVAFYSLLGEQVAVNVRHYRVYNVEGAGLSDQALANLVSARAAPRYKAWMPASHTYMGCKLQIISPVKRPHVTSTSNAGAGALASDPLPDQCAAVVKLKTDFVGRKNRGRVYLGGFTEVANGEGNRIEAATQTQILAWASDLLNPYVATDGNNGVGLSPIIWQRGLEAYTNITSYQVNASWGTQRRRSTINRPDAIPIL